MPRYLAGVSWRDMLSSEEVARRCGLREIDVVLRKSRLRWFGHFARRGEDVSLARVRNVVALGRRPPGDRRRRGKRIWKKK